MTRMKLSCRDFGGAGNPPLLVLHGLLGSARNWAAAGPRMAGRRHVLALDLRNHGDSAHSPVHDYASMAADVIGWMDETGIERAEILGHSMGGKVAMWLACRRPERVERLIVADIAPKKNPPFNARVFTALNALKPERLRARSEADEILAEHGVGDWVLRQFLLTNLDRVAGEAFRWRINLPALTAALDGLGESPILADDRYAGASVFILGGKSPFVSDGDHPLIRRHFPRASIEVLPEAGHNVHVEDPEGFVRAVLG